VNAIAQQPNRQTKESSSSELTTEHAPDTTGDAESSIQQNQDDEDLSQETPPPWIKRLPAILRPDLSKKLTVRAPVVVFRRWAKTAKPFVPTFLILMFFGLVGAAFFPRQINAAGECCRRSFWRCLGRAFVFGATVGITIRILNLLVITYPLADLLVGAMQFCFVSGLVVAISLLGERIMTRTGIAKTQFMSAHPRFATFARIFIGSLVIALIVQIPGIGHLPRIGIRIALLIATLGLGGLLKTKFGREPLEPA